MNDSEVVYQVALGIAGFMVGVLALIWSLKITGGASQTKDMRKMLKNMDEPPGLAVLPMPAWAKQILLFIVMALGFGLSIMFIGPLFAG